jgi:hypothetical protein
MSTRKSSTASVDRVSLDLRRFIAPLVVAAALGASSAYAADRHLAVVRAAHVKNARPATPAKLQPLDVGPDGILVAPGCPSCLQQSKPASFLDWVRAQLEHLMA